MLPRTTLLALAATATITLNGGAYDTTATAAAHRSTLHVTADAHGKLRFNTKSLTARAGAVTIILRNPKTSGMPHGIGIFCPVPGHAPAGMKGTLTIR